MKGTVLFFNVSKGFGFITGEGKSALRFFVHQTDIRMEGFRALQPGEEVEFEFVVGPDGLLQAKEVRQIAGPKLAKIDDSKTLNPEKGGVIPLTIIRRRTEDPVVPGEEFLTLGGNTFSAYAVNGKVNGFRLSDFTPYDGEEVWLVLDPERKELVIVNDGSYEFCPAGSYLMRMSYDGEVVIYTLGRRHQKENGKDLNWAVVEGRFRHSYDISRPINEQETPTTPGLERDNDGFVPSIEVCRRFLIDSKEEARKE